MNNPAYVIPDVIGLIVASVAVSLNRTIGYHYGYVTELNETLVQYNGSPATFNQKFPLVWLAQPFTISTGGNASIYGEIDELRLFIITDSKVNYKAPERMTLNYKPILYPILYSLISKIVPSVYFQGYAAQLRTKITDRYWWGEGQQSVLNDVVDIIEVKINGLKIQNNLNC